MINITADVTAPPLSGITEKYNYSKKRGNASAKGYDMSQIRNFCYKDGKLYCVYESSRILVLNAQTGEKLGFLSNGDVVIPAAAKLADIKCIDGVLVASNIGMTTDNAAGHTKKLLLSQREPQTDPNQVLKGDYGNFNTLALRAKQASELFLIIGPPGTGKTSFGMLNLVKEQLQEEGTDILLLCMRPWRVSIYTKRGS